MRCGRGMRVWRRVLVGLILLAWSVGVAAQAPTRFFEWEHPDTDITANIVSRFEIAIDDGAWVDVGMASATGSASAGFKLFRAPVPALTPGPHTVAVRACNASLCGEATPTLAFVFDVKPATPIRLRFSSEGL